MLAHQIRIRLAVLALLVIAAFLSLSWEFQEAIKDDAYFVAHEDEVIYYGSAQLFAETQSLQAESCIAEDVSKVGKFNWYGPGYNVVYGTLKMVFGNANSLFIRFHFVLACLILVIVFLSHLPMEDKLLLAGILLISEQFTVYIYSYFPELLHLFFSTALVYVLWQIYRQQSTPRWISLFLMLVLAFSLCRITTIFFLAALLPLGSNWRQRGPMMLIFVLGIVASVLYLRFCIAPPYAGEMHKLEKLYTFSIWNFLADSIKATLANAWRIVTTYSGPVFVLLGLCILAIFNFWKTKDRFQLAAVLVALCLLGTLMAFYSVSPFYFVKQTAMLLPLLLVAAMRGPLLVTKWGLLLVVIYFWIPVNKHRTKAIEEHQHAFANLQNNASLREAFQLIRTSVEAKKDLVILWCYNEYDYGSAAQALLPYSTASGNTIMYTTNIVFDQAVDPKVKFKLHHKLRVDYILSRQPLDWLASDLKLQTPYFYLYRNPTSNDYNFND
jgi:hypothetical protein